VIVILGTGQAAQHIADPLRERGIPYLFLSRKDWADREELIGLIKDANPKAVINCAAQRDIALCESKPHEADEANVYIPLAVSEAGFRQVYISTDYVYDLNEKNRTLHEEEPSHGALSVYGQSKLRGEQVVLERGGIVVRISSPFGPHKSPFKASFADFAMSSQNNLELPCDQHFKPTYMPDAAPVIVDLALDGDPGIYHVTNEGTTDWAVFASFVREQVKNKAKVVAVTRKDKTRPMWGNLKNTKLQPLRHWAEAVQEYVRKGL